MSAIKSNFVEEYVDYGKMCTNTDEQYHLYSAYTILSQTVMDKLEMEMSYGTFRPNLWIILVGESTLTHKTTSMTLAENIVRDAGLDNILPTDFSPEGLIEHMATTPKGYMWLDEIGGLLEKFGKDYMSDGQEVMMKLYSGKSVHKVLTNKQVKVDNPCLGLFGTTTPATMKQCLDEDDMFKGFGARFLQVYYDKKYEWSKPKGMTNKIEQKKDDIIDTVKAIRMKFQRTKTAKMTEDAMDKYSEWDKEIMGSLVNDGHKSELSSLYGRVRDYVLKFAMLEEIGDDWWNISPTLDILEITEDSIDTAINLIETYMNNIRLQIIKSLHDKRRMYVYEKIDERGPIERSNLLRLTHMKARELDERLGTLMDAQLVEMDTVQTNTKPKKMYDTTGVGFE